MARPPRAKRARSPAPQPPAAASRPPGTKAARPGSKPPSPARGSAPPPRPSEERICVGVIVGAHGLKGQVRVKSFTDEPGDCCAYGPVSDEGGGRSWRARLTGEGKGIVLLALEGVADRSAAEALKGTRLHVPRTALPALEEDEFYYSDLVGLRVELEDGTRIGRIEAVHDFGAGPMLDLVRDPASIAPLRERFGWDSSDGVLLPFTRAAVPVIDIKGGRIVMTPPPGLFEPVKPEEEAAEAVAAAEAEAEAASEAEPELASGRNAIETEERQQDSDSDDDDGGG